MPATRRNRSWFTSSLAAICQRLDAKSSALIQWKYPIVNIDCSSRVTVTSLWAVGSYARGALNCGDLDLLVELVNADSPPAPERMVATALLQGAKGVSLQNGTPQANTSEVEFPEARLIWQGQGCDWQGAIEAITPDPAAGHFARQLDRIPLRPAQLGCDVEDLEGLIELEQREIIRWTFTPMGAAPAVGLLSPDELELTQAVQWSCGRQTRLLLPHLVTYWRQCGGWTKPFLRANFNKAMMGIGGAKVLVGRPVVPVGLLDDLTTSELLIVPHLSARGPNGVWRIERGEQHPMALDWSKLRVYALFGADAQPDFYRRADAGHIGGQSDSNSAHGIDLFTSLYSARDWNQQGVDDGQSNLVARMLSPRELLSCLSRVDLASINLTDFSMTRRGQVALGHIKVTTTPEVLQALAG